MERQGIKVQSLDFVFSVCVGIYFFSTLWLLCGGAWRKFQGQRMEKSVLRPALMGGFVWAMALVCQTYAMLAVPYAVAYCAVVGGALGVSLLWGILAFGEAAGAWNRRCVAASFAGVFVGIVLLGLSA